MAVDIVLYNAVALSVRKFPSKIKFAFPQRRTLEESKHPRVCNEKQSDNMPHSEHVQIKEMPHKITP